MRQRVCAAPDVQGLGGLVEGELRCGVFGDEREGALEFFGGAEVGGAVPEEMRGVGEVGFEDEGDAVVEVVARDGTQSP